MTFAPETWVSSHLFIGLAEFDAETNVVPHAVHHLPTSFAEVFQEHAGKGPETQVLAAHAASGRDFLE